MSIPALQDFGFDAEHQAIFDTAYRYAREHLHALAPRMDREDWFPEEAFRALGAELFDGASWHERTVQPAYAARRQPSPSFSSPFSPSCSSASPALPRDSGHENFER